MRQLARRIEQAPAVDAAGLAGAGMTVVGVVVAVAALVEASRATAGAALLPWYDRLLLGLWELRLERAAWLTAGLVVLWWALAHGASFGGRRVDVARIAGGLAVGFALVAAAVVIAATVVALSDSVGGIHHSPSNRLAGWLLQTGTGLGAAFVLVVLAVRLPAALPAPAPPDPDPEPAEPDLEELPPPQPPPPPVAVRPPPPAVPAAAAEEVVPAPPAPATAYQEATRIYQERLAYSPQRERARELLDQVAAAERAGSADEADRLVSELSAL